MNNKDSLGNRMKEYEKVSSYKLIKRMPVILRFDGRSFHTFTRGFVKPFDEILSKTMELTMSKLCIHMQGAVFGYTQSDEITIVLIDYQTLETDCWFDYRLEKICSIGASMATLYFNDFYKNVCEFTFDKYGSKYTDDMIRNYRNKQGALFDCRAFNMSKEEVCNNIIWRQKDAERNSIRACGQSFYNHKELQGISNNDLQNKMLVEQNFNWNNLETRFKRGSACIKKDGKWVVDNDMPILTQDRDYVNNCILYKEEE